MTLITRLAALIIAFAAMTASGQSTILRVLPANADATPGDGSTWQAPILGLSQALILAGDLPGEVELWLTGGLYRPVGDGRDATFPLTNGLTIRGGFAGSEQSPADRTPGSPPTILCGDLGTPGDPADNARHVIAFDETAATAQLENLTIQRGNADGSGDLGRGGGIWVRSANLTLARCLIQDCSANDGGAINQRFGELHLIDSTISACSASEGGGILSKGLLTLNGGTILGCDADFGGALSIDGGSAQITDADLLANTAVNGGAIYASGGTVQLERLRIQSNTASRGGAIYNNADTLTVHTSLFLNGFASQGGALYSLSDALLIGCAIVGGFATENGAGVLVDGGDATIINCTILENRALIRGGGVLAQLGSATLLNSILAANRDGFGTGAPAQAFGGILASLSVSYSLTSGGLLTGQGNLQGSPQFLDRAGPDGLLATLDDRYTLRPDAIGVDAGDSPAYLAVGGPALDLSGQHRFTNSPAAIDLGIPLNTGETIDIGAGESPGFSRCDTDIDGDGIVGLADLNTILQAFGAAGVGDFDQDGVVSLADLNQLLTAFGIQCDE